MTATLAPTLVKLLVISSGISQSDCFTTHHGRSMAFISGTTDWRSTFSMKRLLCTSPGPSYRHLHTFKRNTESDDQPGMKEAFESLNTLTPDDVAPSWKEKPQTPLKYSRTDDTQAYYYGKSSEDEVEHYLDLQMDLEAPLDEIVSSTADDTDEADGPLFELFNEEETDNVSDLISDETEQHPWNSINPILRLRGPVATGYGRGGKKLGVPTANLPSSLFQSALENIDAGVYFGWAVIEDLESDSNVGNVPIKAVVNVGYSPTFEGEENREKIVEAHLITRASPMTKYGGAMDENNDNREEEIEIDKDFYGETMRLQLIGFLRPEQKFDSFPDLIAQIHCDIGYAAAALDSFPYNFSKEDEFISNTNSVSWVGSGGGDTTASWEYETW